MTTFSWRDNLGNAQPGDMIIGNNGDGPVYIENVRVRQSNITNLISPEVSLTFHEYTHSFEWEDMPGAGYSFPCYKDGKLPEREYVVEGGVVDQDKYFEMVKAQKGLKYLGIRDYSRTWNEPAVIRCHNAFCDGEVVLNMVMTNTCDKCGADYNSFGQLLAPRSQWGEDTGESLYDIMSADRDINDREFSELDFDA